MLDGVTVPVIPGSREAFLGLVGEGTAAQGLGYLLQELAMGLEVLLESGHDGQDHVVGTVPGALPRFHGEEEGEVVAGFHLPEASTLTVV